MFIGFGPHSDRSNGNFDTFDYNGTTYGAAGIGIRSNTDGSSISGTDCFVRENAGSSNTDTITFSFIASGSSASCSLYCTRSRPKNKADTRYYWAGILDPTANTTSYSSTDSPSAHEVGVPGMSLSVSYTIPSHQEQTGWTLWS